MKALKITCYILVLIVLYSNSAFAWKTNKGNAVKMGTHERLTEYAVTNYTHLKRCPDQDDSNCDILKKIGLTFGLDEILTWGQKKEVWKWLILGADREDAGTLINMVTNSARFNNHFHNPLKDWESAGLSELIALPPFFLEGKSSLLWAQDSDYQSDPKWPEGDWTWEKTREYYYAALTGATDAERQAFFARMFKGLGHQAHLLQDKAVPAHVRNDAHPLPWHIEKWMADNPNVMRCLIEDHQTLDPSFVLDSCVQKDENGNIVLDESGNPVLKFKQVEVIKPEVLSMDTTDMILDPSYTSYYGTGRKLEKTSLLTDTDQYRVGDSPSASYSIGLAEYTNGNFFSPDTIFAETKDPDHRHFSPNPSRAITNLSELESNNIIPKTFVAEDGIPDGIKCIKKNAPGEEVDCLVRAGYLTDPSNNGESAIYERTFILDAPSHESYVKHLVPRAIGYSAALIDYFFRSKLEISPPDQYVYSIIDGGDIDLDDNTQYIRLLKAKVRNDTPDEEMLAGSLVAVTKYKKIIGYQPDLSSGSPTAEMREAEFSYSVSAPIEIASLSSTDPEEFTFDFTNTPIPAGITDLYLQVVFRGTLGNEVDQAVAVGMRDINEPQHITVWNDTDYFQLNSIPVKADDIRDDPDVALYGYIDPYPFTESIGFSKLYPDIDAPPIVTMEDLPPARYSRLILVTDSADTSYYLTDHIEAYWPPDEPETDDPTFNAIWKYNLPTAIHQEINGSWQSSPVYRVRDVVQHQSLYLMNSYPWFVYNKSLPAPPENALGSFPPIINFSN